MVRQHELGWIGEAPSGEILFEHDLLQAPWKQELIETVHAAFPPSVGAGEMISLQPTAGPAGSYRFSGKTGSWFVRVSSRWGSPEIEMDLVNFLVERGVSVNLFMIVGVELEWEGLSYRVDVRELIDGRHYDGTKTDVSSVAEAIRRCHHALRDFPRAEEVRSNRRVIAETHTKTRNSIADALRRDDFEIFGPSESWAITNKQFLSELVDGYEPNQMDLEGAQCIHGDLHPGNVIYQGSGKAMLIDFEYSPAAFAPVEWDLAYLVQRFCLRQLSGSALTEGLETVARVYGTPMRDLADAMRQTCWYCVTAAQVLCAQGIVVPVSEYEKFAMMSEQANEMRGLLAEAFF
jgi:hypothetical protein